MKKILTLIFLLCSINTFAQQDSTALVATNTTPVINTAKSETIWVHKSDIPAAVLEKLQNGNKIQAVEKKAENLINTASWGTALGESIDTTLTIVTNNVDRFSNTFVGKYTVFMTLWYVLGERAVNFIIGLFIFVSFFILWVYSYRKNFGKKKLAEEFTFIHRKFLWIIPYKIKKVNKIRLFNPMSSDTVKTALGGSDGVTPTAALWAYIGWFAVTAIILLLGI